MVRLSAAQMQLIVDGHNTRRNTIASGNLPGFLQARRMAQMIWNTQLTEFAELNTKQCQMVLNFDKSKIPRLIFLFLIESNTINAEILVRIFEISILK